MRPDVAFERRFIYLLALAVLLAVLVLSAAGATSYRDLAAARAKEAELADRIRHTQERIETLEDRIRRLKEDPVTLERVAREELGLVREGDVVIVFEE